MVDAVARAAIAAHDEWLGFVQPVGLVVAPPMLVERSVVIDRNIRPRQEVLDSLLDDTDENAVVDIKSLFTDLLGWEEGDLLSPEPEHRVRLTELDVTLEPDWRVVDREGATQLLIRGEPKGTDLDDLPGGVSDGWSASPQARFERLLRTTGIAAGLLCTPEAVRLVNAPAGETSGHLTFRIADMAQVMGRPILAAFTLLLGEYRLFRAEPRERLTGAAGLLAASREAQNLVSTRLARQVLGALHELLRGLVASDARRQDGTAPIHRLAAEKPHELYAGLVTVLMRLVFVLYAEERDLMPVDRLYEDNYGLRGLFKKLRDAAARHGDDLMDRRYGAWPRLLSLFRLIHAGGGREGFAFTARKGRLFDPDRFPFLEGRETAEGALGSIPMVSDGTVWHVLERLLVLDGERISYRTLDVEEIGSVYQAIMGFRIEQRAGRALALKSRGRHGAGTIVDLDDLLTQRPPERKRRLNEFEVAALTPREERAVADAATVEALAQALIGKVDEDAAPALMPPGQPLLQPTDERRRSGSHYTPRSLTQPIVAETLRPILERLGPQATPEQILSLKVLDPAMGSGAFLVEACRQLADALVHAWDTHGAKPDLPRDEDLLLYAKRLIVQRCIYGVDRNELAAELGKLSLWLATLARDHEFSFLDHCIRHGDSLVGLNRRQIEALSWTTQPAAPVDLMQALLRARLAAAEEEREHIRRALEDASEDLQRLILQRAAQALADPKLVGDAVVAAFFSTDKARAREEVRLQVRSAIEQGGTGWQKGLKPAVTKLRNGTPPVVPFHWVLEFPEVFDRANPGFDAIVGNPPFAGRVTTTEVNALNYVEWLQTLHPGAHGNSDIVAHFFRRAYSLLRDGGCLGLLATNTIRQGDTRATGLRPIRKAGGTIYTARRRYKWPGEAAVVVSVVHIAKGNLPAPYWLDGRAVPMISAFLFHDGGDDDPRPLRANAGKSFQGCVVVGRGFEFDDTDTDGVASPLAEMRQIIDAEPKSAEVIFPYIGGDEVNTSPTQAHHRYVINFGECPEHECRQAWPALMALVEKKVRPDRELALAKSWSKDKEKRAKYWWQFSRTAKDLYTVISGLERVLATGQTSAIRSFVFLSSSMVFSQKLVIFPSEDYHFFGVMQSRVHELAASFFGSSRKDDPVYTPSDCFETFPFPRPGSDSGIEAVGREYYEFRAALMIEYNEGLTKVYNRFHDPGERSNAIGELRRLHDAMDRAVLDAYGWTDIRPTSEFELEWEDEETENGRRRRKPWRYRWSEPVRDEVLARLLALNAQRAEEEQLDFGDR